MSSERPLKPREFQLQCREHEERLSISMSVSSWHMHITPVMRSPRLRYSSLPPFWREREIPRIVIPPGRKESLRAEPTGRVRDLREEEGLKRVAFGVSQGVEPSGFRRGRSQNQFLRNSFWRGGGDDHTQNSQRMAQRTPAYKNSTSRVSSKHTY